MIDTEHATTTADWRALGTYVHLAVTDAAALPEAREIAELVLEDVDRTCSRFRADSDLTRANAAAGTWVDVDPILAAAATAAVNSAEATDGLVDPCLGRPLVSLGYDRTFSAVQERDAREWGLDFEPAPDQAWRELEIDLDGRIRVPAGASLDLGATAKAWTADVIALTVVGVLQTGVLVSLGGDIRIEQADGHDRGWSVRVTERPDQAEGETVVLWGGGLATSSTQARRWTTRGGEFHHLLDPRTGRPVDGPWRTVTATGPTALAANTATTASLVLGDRAVEWLDERSVTARLVGRDGNVRRVGTWPEQEGDVE